MEKIKGRNMLLWVDGVCVAGNTECDLTITRDTIETASPTQGKWKTYKATRASWSMSSSHLVIMDDSVANNSNLLLFTEGVRSDIYVTVSFQLVDNDDSARLPNDCTSNGKFGFTGTAIITECDIKAQVGNRLNGTFKFQGTGSLS